MGFSISTHGMPRITNYEQAAALYARVKPIRGTDTRPIGDRRKQHMQVVKIEGLGEPSYALRLYSTDVVIYRADGTTLINVGYASQSTALFASRMGPRGMTFRLTNNNVLCYVQGKGTFASASGKFEVSAAGELMNYDTLCLRKVNLKKAAAARKRYAPCLKFLRDIAKILIPTMTTESYRELRDANPLDFGVAYARACSDDESQWMALFAAYTNHYYGYSTHATFAFMDKKLASYLSNEAYDEEGCYYYDNLPAGVIKSGWRFAKD